MTIELQPRMPLRSRSLLRAADVVDRVLERATRSGEWTVTLARLALSGGLFVAWPAVTWEQFRAREPAILASWALLLAALSFSTWMLWFLRHKTMTPTVRYASVIADSVLVLGVLAAFVARPPPGYLGLTHIEAVGAVYFAILAAGGRLSRNGAVLSFAVNAVGLAVLAAVDSAHVQSSTGSLVTVAALTCTAGVFAYQNAVRTRRLVLEGAEQTLIAERARSRLGAYVSEEVASHVLDNDELQLGGARQRTTILFTDLRNFTSMAETAEPEELVRELNEYFDAMVEAIASERGVVDKYIGDSIMAVFGALSPSPDDAARAIRAAWKMEQALALLNAQRAQRGKLPLQHGIGIHTGIVVAGNIGTRSRANYTVIGDTVNVAARLESATKELRVGALISQVTVEEARGSPSAASLPLLRELSEIHVKGRAEPIAIFTLDVMMPPV